MVEELDSCIQKCKKEQNMKNTGNLFVRKTALSRKNKRIGNKSSRSSSRSRSSSSSRSRSNMDFLYNGNNPNFKQNNPGYFARKPMRSDPFDSNSFSSEKLQLKRSTKKRVTKPKTVKPKGVEHGYNTRKTNIGREFWGDKSYIYNTKK